MGYTIVIPFKTFGGSVFADKFFQEFHLMIVMFLETICAGSPSLPRPPTDILDLTCILGPKMTLVGMMLR
jgi:hypothetical protein